MGHHQVPWRQEHKEIERGGGGAVSRVDEHSLGFMTHGILCTAIACTSKSTGNSFF